MTKRVDLEKNTREAREHTRVRERRQTIRDTAPGGERVKAFMKVQPRRESTRERRHFPDRDQANA